MEVVIFICETCRSYNGMNRGMPEHQEQQVEYDSLTDAFLHLMSTHLDRDSSAHYMTTLVKSEE